MLAHGAVLRKNFFSASQVVEIYRDFHSAGLEPAEVAIMAYAQKVALQAEAVEQADIDRLRVLGLEDAEIGDIALASAARCFFSKYLDGIGAEPDALYRESEAELYEALKGDGLV
jgi:alkylhydroperoxidase family enzyme